MPGREKKNPCEECNHSYVGCKSHCQTLVLWDENHPKHKLGLSMELDVILSDQLEAVRQAKHDQYLQELADKEVKIKLERARKKAEASAKKKEREEAALKAMQRRQDRNRVRSKEYYREHKEEIGRKKREKRQREQPEDLEELVERVKHAEYMRRWCAAHKDKVKEWCHDYYEKHKEEIKAKNRQKYAEKCRKEDVEL